MYNIVFPELVQKNIAEFLEPVKKSCTIRIQQNAGCIKGEHSSYTISDNCIYCSKRYNPGQIFFYLLKGGNKQLFKHWINKIKKDCMNDEYIIRHSHNGWVSNYSQYSKVYPKFKDLFNSKKLWVGKRKLFSWEKENYESKYILEGLHFSLFRDFVYNLPCLNSIIRSFHFHFQRTIESSSLYTDIFLQENKKNSLCSINKIFNKYCKYT